MEKYSSEKTSIEDRKNEIIDSKAIYTRKTIVRSIPIHSIETNPNQNKSCYQKIDPKRQLTTSSPNHYYHKICPIHINSYVKSNFTKREENFAFQTFINHSRNESILNEMSFIIRFK